MKATLYAQAGIKEYWIINLRHDQVEVHLQPNREAGVYNTIQRFDRAATFSSPFCGELSVAELLPAPLPEDKIA